MTMQLPPPTSSTSLPLRWLLTAELEPDPAARASLETLARVPALAGHVAVLPDVHLKHGRATPTGTVFAARDAILPGGVDTGIGCGIRMARCPLPAGALAGDDLDRLFAELMRAVPVAEHATPLLAPADLDALLIDANTWCARRYGAADADRLDPSAGADGEDPEAVIAAVPEKAKRRGLATFGTLGAGNHFLELQEVAEIVDAERAAAWGLALGQAFFMIHTGSRALGSKTMKAIVRALDPEAPLAAIDTRAPGGRAAALAIRAASRVGFANRAAIHDALRRALGPLAGGGADPAPLLFDCAHVSIEPERWEGETLWVHRHGASRAMPGSRLAPDSPFARTGQPVPVPGSMGHGSFVCAADEGALQAFGSVNHGAGRALDKPEAAARFTEAMIEGEMETRGIRLYRYGAGRIAEQAPAAFKSLPGVIAAMAAHRLAHPVARLRPVAVLKG